MPMTKAERATMDAWRVRAALSWPAPPPKPVDLAVAFEGGGRKVLRAWWFSVHLNTVGEGVTDGCHHSKANYTDKQLANRYAGYSRVSMSQTPGGPWFSSKEDALRALLFAAAEDCAKRLAAIERQIEEA